jgi:hypothetical protein
MKIIIKESQLGEIIKSTEVNELFPTEHFGTRKDERFLTDTLDVVVSVPYKGTLNHTVVGTYTIPKQIKDEINNKINYLLKTKIDRKISLGIILYKFNNIKVSDIRWVNDKARYITLKTLQDNYRTKIYVSDSKTNSIGDMLFLVVRDNAIITIKYERKHGLELNREHEYDEIITNVEDIEKYKID